MLRAIRSLALISLVAAFAGACVDQGADQGDGANATPQSIIASQLHPGPHLGLTMTPAVKACREQCWAEIPFNECAKQRDACLTTASSIGEQHHCRQMSLACGQLRRECMQGCWLGKTPSPNPLEEQETARLSKRERRLGLTMTPAVRSCRQACWEKTPRNACAKQRDACLETASGDDAQHACRVASMGCRRERTACMQSCWTDGNAVPAEQQDDDTN